MKKWNQQEFEENFEKAREERNIKLKLTTNSVYLGMVHKMEFICQEHNKVVYIKPQIFFYGKDKTVIGCSDCLKEYQKNTSINNMKRAIEDFERIHQGKYKYPNIQKEYINSHSFITAVCSEHGQFKIKAYAHKVSGCKECAIQNTRKSTEEFIQQASEQHNNKYDYSLVKIESMGINSRGKIKIICPIHGEFIQFAADHLYRGSGCPKCMPRSYSKSAIKWLNKIMEQENIYIQHAENDIEYRIPNTNFLADGYCAESNTIYEFHGDVFHGNINIFKPDETPHPFDRKVTTQQLYDKTMRREQMIKGMGYNLVTIWESDYKKIYG